MPDKIRFVAQMVFLLYAACAGVILAMNKVGHLTASIAQTKYTPEAERISLPGARARSCFMAPFSFSRR